VLENVCFGQEMDPPWLEKVLEACALGPDVDSFPAGVHTRIGEQVRVLGLFRIGRLCNHGTLASLTCGQYDEGKEGVRKMEEKRRPTQG
jgi:hypothetical protein